jgi:predicted Zn-dependent protease
VGKERVRLEELTPPVAKPVNAPVVPLGKEAELLVIDAERRVSRGDFSGAIDLLSRPVAPADSARVAKALGLAYLGLGERAKALVHLRQAEHAAGDDVLLQLILGQLQVSSGQAEEGIVSLRRALQCTGATAEDALTGEVMLSLGELLAANGYLAAADDCFAKLYDWVGLYGRSYVARPRLRPLVVQPSRLLVRRGELLMRLRRYDQARDVLHQAYTRDRTDMQAAELLLRAHLAVKDFTAAEKLLLDIAAEPAARDRLPGLAQMVCQAAKEPAMPARIWRMGRRQAVGAGELAVALAQAARQLHAEREAKEILDSALKTMPNDVAVGRYLAEQDANAGDAPAALRRLAGLMKADAETVETVNQTLQTLADEGLLPAGLEDRFAQDAEADTSDLKGVLHYLAGELADLRDKTALAAQQYQAAVEADGSFLPAYEAAEDLWLESGRDDRADRLVERLKALAESDESVRYYALYLEGKNHLAHDRLADAARVLEASYDEEDFSPALGLLSEVYGRLGRPDRTIEALNEMLKLQPAHEDSYRRLFDLCVSMGRIDQARSVMVRLLQVQPNNRTGQAMFVEMLLLTGKAEEGTRVLEELRHQAGDAPAVRLLNVRLAASAAAGAISRQQFDDWTANLGEVLAKVPDSLPARRLLAELLARTGRHDQASAVLGELYEENPGLPDLAKGYVLALVQSEDYSAAQAILESNPVLQQNLQARQWLLQVLGQQGRLEEAARYLREWLATSTDKTFGDFCRLQLLNVYERLRDFSAAQRQIDELLAANPPRQILLELQVTKVRLLCSEGKFDQAVDLAKTWTGGEDQAIALKLAFAGVLADAGQYGRVQELLDEWINRCDPGEEQDVLAESKIRLFIRAGQPEVAREYVRAWIVRCPAALMPRQSVIAVLMDAEEYDQAVRLMDGWMDRLDFVPSATTVKTQPTTTATAATQPSQSAPASQPASALAASGPARPTSTSTASTSQAVGTSQPAPVQLGALPAARVPKAEELAALKSWCREGAVQILLLMQKYDQALDRACLYLRDEPNSARLLSLQSSALSELGRSEESLAAIEKAHALAGDDAGICNNLGYLYADTGIRLPEAEGLIRQALTARRDEKDFQDSLGWVLYKQGKLAAAAEVFDRFLEGGKAVWPTCAISYDHAGDVYYRLGWTEKAAELWSKAVALARREKTVGRDLRRLLTEGPAKVQAVQTNRAPAVAPLGQGVEEQKQ